ncbi:hypothetical protein FOZ60_007271, partial [Perkinsus olseni]
SVDLTLSEEKNEIWVDAWVDEVQSALRDRGHAALAGSVKKCIKFLGLWLDQKLSWNTNVTESIARIRKLAIRLRSLVGRRWGLGSQQLRWIWNSVMTPRLTFGAPIWGTVAGKEWFEKNVDSLCSAKRHIFCDGAVELAPFGRENAVVWFSYTRLPDHATVMQGELRGIEAAANRLTSTQDNPLRQAVIYSDSQAAIRAVTGQCKLESTSVRNARRAVERAAVSCDLVVQWTELIRVSAVKAKFREEEEWRWRKARQLTYIKKTGVMLDRRQCRRLRAVAVSMNDRRLICEALTGHGCLRAHLSRLDGGMPECRYCGRSRESSIHLHQCSRWRRWREACLGKDALDNPYDMTRLLASNHSVRTWLKYMGKMWPTSR